jgi:hypothetical protein
MSLRAFGLGLFSALMLLPVVHSSADSKQQAESLARKISRIEQHASTKPRAPMRTPLSEGEVNSWFTYNAPPLLPAGVAQPKLTIVGNRRVIGAATVDLDAVAKTRRSGRTLDIWNLIGGRVPVTVSGLLHAEGGRAKFQMESAEMSGLPVPRFVVDEMLRHYTRTPNHPNGLRLDDSFPLPAGIQQIEISPGAAVIIQ